MEPIRLWSGTDEGALRERSFDGLLVMEVDSQGGRMDQIGMSTVEDQNTSQQKKSARQIETKTPMKAQESMSEAEAPCSCPGCFSFDF